MDEHEIREAAERVRRTRITGTLRPRITGTLRRRQRPAPLPVQVQQTYKYWVVKYADGRGTGIVRTNIFGPRRLAVMDMYGNFYLVPQHPSAYESMTEITYFIGQ